MKGRGHVREQLNTDNNKKKKKGQKILKNKAIFTGPENSRYSFSSRILVASVHRLDLVSGLLLSPKGRSKQLLSPKCIVSCVFKILTSPAEVQWSDQVMIYIKHGSKEHYKTNDLYLPNYYRL